MKSNSNFIKSMSSALMFLLVYLRATCILSYYSFTLPNSETCFKWLHAIKQELNGVKEFSDYFAVHFSIVSKTDRNGPWDLVSDNAYKLGDELDRLGFNLKTTWRITNINDKYKLVGCASSSIC